MKMPPTATASLLLIAAFMGGLLAGVLLERTVFGVPEVHAAVQPPPVREGGPWDLGTLTAELDLTQEQQGRIERILTEQQRQVRAILSETRPQTRAVLKETRTQVEEVLTAEQQAIWREMIRRTHRHGPKRGPED